MNTSDNGRAARSRANLRLRKLTIGTAVAGIVATGGFGWIAAVTHEGATADAATALTTTTHPATTTTTTATSSTTASQVQAAPQVLPGNGPGHATTGGS